MAEGLTLHPCRLYLISPPQIALDEFEGKLRAALEAGDVGAFQLRLKETDEAAIEQACLRLLPLCREFGVAFLLNDLPLLAKKVGADGVHLGQDDLQKMPIRKAREILGEEAVIGVSCHDSKHLAMEAGEQGADYVAFGAFFPTTSKAPEKLAKYGTTTAEILSWWGENTILPSVAIGGMTPDNCAPLVQAGADFIAVINGVWQHPQGAAAAVAAFNRSIKEGLKQRTPSEDA